MQKIFFETDLGTSGVHVLPLLKYVLLSFLAPYGPLLICSADLLPYKDHLSYVLYF